MANIEEKLEAVDSRFRHGSKQWEAARYIVQRDHELTTAERKALVQEIPIKYGSLTGLITELRKMGLYPPQATSGIPIRPPTLEKPKAVSHPVPEVPQQPLQDYATKEDFEAFRDSTKEHLETLVNSVNGLAALLNVEERPSNPGEDEEEEEDEDEMIPPGDLIQPGEVVVQDGSSTMERVDIKPKTRMYFDLARQGAFHNYPGTREPGPFANFQGNISDFFNVLTDEFFIRNYNADIGLTMVMPVK